VAERSFYVIVYDVVEDRRRRKLAKYLESLGERVQKSVFELYLTPAELERVLKRAKRLIKLDEDSLRVYDLCAACRKKVTSLGVGQVTAPPDVTIV